jgi:myosin VIIa
VNQTQGERNYHIFCQLIAGAEAHPKLKTALRLDSPSFLNYLNQSGADRIEGVSDKKDFEDVKAAMDTLRILPADQQSIFRTVAAVLHLGNVKFEVEVQQTGEVFYNVNNSSRRTRTPSTPTSSTRCSPARSTS